MSSLRMDALAKEVYEKPVKHIAKERIEDSNIVCFDFVDKYTDEYAGTVCKDKKRENSIYSVTLPKENFYQVFTDKKGSGFVEEATTISVKPQTNPENSTAEVELASK